MVSVSNTKPTVMMRNSSVSIVSKGGMPRSGAGSVPACKRFSRMAISITCSDAMVKRLYASMEISKCALKASVSVLASARAAGNRRITEGRGADVIVDTVGDRYAEPALKAIAWKGRYCVVGFAAGAIPRIAAIGRNRPMPAPKINRQRAIQGRAQHME